MAHLNQWKTGQTRVRGTYCGQTITGIITDDISGWHCTLKVTLDSPIDVYGIIRNYVMMEPRELEVAA